MAVGRVANEECQSGPRGTTGSANLFQDLVSVPVDRRHESGVNRSLPGLVVAICVTIPGAVVLGAGYGSCVALCGEHLVNIALFCSIPFWISIPTQLGCMWGKLRNPKWRYGVEILGFVCCLYSIYVGWLFAVLDGPGLVLDASGVDRVLGRFHRTWYLGGGVAVH